MIEDIIKGWGFRGGFNVMGVCLGYCGVFIGEVLLYCLILFGFEFEVMRFMEVWESNLILLEVCDVF